MTRHVAKTPEGFTKKEARAILDDLGLYYAMPVQMGYGRRLLDFIICGPNGRFISCEAKRKGAKPKAFQEKIVREIRQKGGIAFVWDREEDFRAQLWGAMTGL